MDSVNERFKKIAKTVGLKSVKALSSELHIPYNTFGTWGKKNKITSDGIFSITKAYPQISKTYLETGEGDVIKLDTGISNYGHDARTKEVCDAYQQMTNEDKEIIYNLMKRFRNKNIILDCFNGEED